MIDKSHMDEETVLTINDKFRLADLYFFKKNYIYRHLYNSFDKFIEEDIPRFLTTQDIVHIIQETITETKIYKHRFIFNNIIIESPTQNNGVEPLFPITARQQSLSYNVKILANIKQELEIIDIPTYVKDKVGFIKKQVGDEVKNVPIAIFPLMLRSKYCNLNKYKAIDKYECEFDPGGYFIVNGAEKCIICQEKMVENKPLIYQKKDGNVIYYIAQINSKSIDINSNNQMMTLKLKKDSVITVKISIFNEINIIIILRALGIESDRDIINYCIYDTNDIYAINVIRPSLNECFNDKNIKITTKEAAIDYLLNKLRITNRKYSETNKQLKQEQKRLHLLDLLTHSFIPHMNGSLLEKGYFLGYIINKLINVSLGRLPLDDRDSYLNKRVDQPGDLLFELFKQQYKKMINECNKFFISRNENEENPVNIIHQIKPSIIEQGIKTALLTGTWIRKKGVAQMLQRLTYLQAISFMRRVDTPSSDSSMKLTLPRQLHPSSVGFLCCVQTPEHAKVGQTKHLALIASITVLSKNVYDILNEFLLKHKSIIPIQNVEIEKFKYMYKIFLNGKWIGMVENGHEFYKEIHNKKLTGNLGSNNISVVWDYQKLEIRIYCESGRMFRPMLRVNNNKCLLEKKHIDLISLNSTNKKIYDWDIFMHTYPNLIEYIDVEEQSWLLLAENTDMLQKMKIQMETSVPRTPENNYILNRYDDSFFFKYSHLEIHPSLLLGEISINSPFIDCNVGPRNIFGYSQGKQAIGIPTSNYRHRLDISFLLYHPQRQLVYTRGSKYINMRMLPVGENVIVAIACYTGYNMEDSLIFNKTSLQRGLFRSTSLRKYMLTIERNHSTLQDDIFMKPDPNKVIGIKHGSYDKLNDQGYVNEETTIYNNDFILGKVTPVQHGTVNDNTKQFRDSSEAYKSSSPGVIDKVYVGLQNQDGYETRKVLVRSERPPQIGDKFALHPSMEVLTSNGWKFIGDINMQDKIATLVDKKYIAYEFPIEIYNVQYDGVMYKVRSNDCDLDVTIDHKLFVKFHGDETFNRTIARTVVNKQFYIKKNGKFNNLNNAMVDLDKLFNNKEFINTKSKMYADYLMTLAIHAGVSATIQTNNNEFNVMLNKNHEPLIDGESSNTLYNYNGSVHCLEVPSNVFMVRLNGKHFWIGNCSMMGQKGTIGLILEGIDMPFTKEGIRPDIILNPNAIPSRMTIGQLLESILGKVASNEGMLADGTPFENYNIDDIKERLKKLGYNENGYEELYNGMTGEKLLTPIFIGPTYYQRLKHLVQDKAHSRSRGPITLLTRQPPEGVPPDVVILHNGIALVMIKVMASPRVCGQHIQTAGIPQKIVFCNT